MTKVSRTDEFNNGRQVASKVQGVVKYINRLQLMRKVLKDTYILLGRVFVG